MGSKHVQQMMHLPQQCADVCNLLRPSAWLTDQNAQQLVETEEKLFVHFQKLLLDVCAGAAK